LDVKVDVPGDLGARALAEPVGHRDEGGVGVGGDRHAEQLASQRLGDNVMGSLRGVELGEVDRRHVHLLREDSEQGLLFEGAAMHEYLSDPAAGLLLLGNRFTELLFGDQAAAGELLTEAGRDRQAVRDEVVYREGCAISGIGGAVLGVDVDDGLVDVDLIGDHEAGLVVGRLLDRDACRDVIVAGRGHGEETVRVLDRKDVELAADRKRQHFGYRR